MTPLLMPVVGMLMNMNESGVAFQVLSLSEAIRPMFLELKVGIQLAV